jgi:uncharacterized membrane protein
MEIFSIILRLLHIFFGIFWVGTALFFVFFFEPILKAAGPAGGTVLGHLALTQFPLVMALSSILTVAAGFTLYGIDSGGFQIGWISTPAGLTLTIGSLAGIVSFLVGLTIQMPANNRISAIQKEIQASGKPPTPAQLQELQGQQERISRASRWEAVLMMISVIGMAMARELGQI